MKTLPAMDSGIWEKFWAFLSYELFITADREMRQTRDPAVALVNAFEELTRRIDFDAHDIQASAPYHVNINTQATRASFVAIAFGNYLAGKGVVIHPPRGADH